MNRKIIIILPIVALIATLILLYIALTNGLLGQAGIRGLDYCEHSRDAIVKQPANTYSNIGFIFAGLLIAWQMLKEKYNHNTNRLTTTLFYPTFFATLCVLMGPGSMAMHASTTLAGSYFDVLSMYLIAAFMFSYALIRLFNLSATGFFSAFSVVLFVCNLVYFYFSNIFSWLDRHTIFGFFIVSATLLEFSIILRNKIAIEKKWAILYCVTFLIAFTIWHFSKTGNILCYEYSLIQGHAIWHLLNALALYFMFRYYVSENKESKLIPS
jgi:hypothetical protein